MSEAILDDVRVQLRDEGVLEVVQELGATGNRSGNSDSLTKNLLFRLPTVEQILSLSFRRVFEKV